MRVLGKVFLITVFVLLIFLFDWSQIDARRTKERIVFVAVTFIGWLLSVLLVFYPDMPGPTQLMEWLLGPLSVNPPEHPPF
ncbi:hypothetical protein [Staphylospora marina]|uniref:hypothetical protein n=1 Tax=Staphylospora marina TaxID=2490858 RepID=UPI000F5BBEBD|nr:hypothetical protein [Staphylospora marina]